VRRSTFLERLRRPSCKASDTNSFSLFTDVPPCPSSCALSVLRYVPYVDSLLVLLQYCNYLAVATVCERPNDSYSLNSLHQ
jgi:hypothetical protein